MSMAARERALYVRDKCTCRYCDLSGMDNFDIWMNLSIDHIIPENDESDENKAVACRECNCLKSTYKPNGNTREERIADARKYVQARREGWREGFDRIIQEGKISN